MCDYPMISGAHALQHTVVPRRGGLGAAVDTFSRSSWSADRVPPIFANGLPHAQVLGFPLE